MKDSLQPFWKRLIWALLIMNTVILALREVREPDLWWQLRTGEYIVEHGEVPREDVFSYTFGTTPWLNVKWGFEVIQASVVRMLGPEWLILPQIIGNLLILLLGYLTIFWSIKDWHRSPLSFSAIILSLFLLMVSLSFRMGGRPEVSSYVLTALFLWTYMRYRNTLDWRWTLVFVPGMILWANLHEAYGVGMVILVTFLVDRIWIGLWNKELKKFFPELGITLLALISVALHPFGWRILWHPIEIFGMFDSNQFTSEMTGFGTVHDLNFYYFLETVFFVLGSMALARFWRESNGFRQFLERVGPLYLILWVGFVYLSFKATRNMPFHFIWATPLIAQGFGRWFTSFKVKPQIWVPILALTYISVGSGLFYKAVYPRERFGISVNEQKALVQSSNFIKENDIKGRALSDYLGSSYLLWALQPDFETFVDLRDLDIFPPDFIQTALLLFQDPNFQTPKGERLFDMVERKSDWDYVVLTNGDENLGLARHLAHHRDYHLVHADFLGSVYLRDRPEFEKLIEKYSYRTGHDPFEPQKEFSPGSFAETVEWLFWPFPTYEDPIPDQQIHDAFYRNLGIPDPQAGKVPNIGLGG
ncbi:MAG: hypothetical protein LPK46_04740 [Bacteroidota bacterium]|nr:hypothetical protein [Bacteroidota bacterium]MDX5505428.1 hypothetical protein [Bacteroidota bacterium]